MSLAGKTLFITGASRGIGLAIGLRAARDGANVAIAAKTVQAHPKLEGTIFTAAEAIERFASCPPDLIVCDIDVPGIDGFELLSELRARERGRSVPAIALTPFARAEDRTRSLVAGYQGHVPKPVDPAELRATAASLLHLSDRRADPA